MPQETQKRKKTPRAPQAPVGDTHPMACTQARCLRRFKTVGYLRLHLMRKHPGVALAVPDLSALTARQKAALTPFDFPKMIFAGVETEDEGQPYATFYEDLKDVPGSRVAVYTLSLVVVKEEGGAQ